VAPFYRRLGVQLALPAVLIMLLSGCGGGLADKAASMPVDPAAGMEQADAAAVEDAAAAEAAAEADAEAARAEYLDRVQQSLTTLTALARSANAWDKAYVTCIDRSPYINDFGPCWDGQGKPEAWSKTARKARRALRVQLSATATSPTCNEAASRVDGRIGDLLAAWANFEETVGAEEVDLANSARGRVFGSTNRFFNSVRSFERKCDNPDDIS